MFVRFQRQRHRLNAGLVQTRREAGRVRTEFIGMLGSVDADVTARERIAFWAKLPGRLESLGNRVRAEDQGKIYAALHARIPMVTPDEQRAIQEENAKDDERFWDAMQDMNASSAEGHKLLAASAEAKRKENERLAAEAAEKREGARERLAKLARGETVSGGLGKRIDVEAMFKAAGFTARDMRLIRLAATTCLTDAEFDAMVRRQAEASIDAGDRVHERELRRIIRERTR